MSDNYQLKELADSVKSQKKSTFLSSIFKKALFDKFKLIDEGFIKLKDGSNTFTFGNKSENLTTSIAIHSQEFYFLLGSGGTIGL